MDLHSPHRMWYKNKQTNKGANALTQDFPPFHTLRAHEPVACSLHGLSGL